MRFAPLIVLALGLMAGCGKKAPKAAAPAFDPVPHLPSPEVGSYARAPSRPKDVVVRAAIGERPWDASLAGAAAGLALAAIDDKGGFTAREVRAAAWRAGYPYPVQTVQMWHSEPLQPAPASVQGWISRRHPSADVGLVRARTVEKEIWVGASAIPKVNLGVIDKSYTLGADLALPSIRDATYIVSDPQGRLVQGALDSGAILPLDVRGEWVVEVSKAEDQVALFPIYIDTDPPVEPVIPTSTVTLTGVLDAKLEAIDLLRMARQYYNYPQWERDPMLEAAAASALEDPDRTLLELATGVGIDAERASLWRCTARTIEDCIDQMVWLPINRHALLDSQMNLVGVAAKLDGPQITVVALIAEG